MTAPPTRLRVADGAALIVASVVGAGIFTVPGYVASVAGHGWIAIALWAAGGLMALAGALCYAELAARYPESGAEYVYLRRAFGEDAGFLSGWTSFVAGFSGAIAAAAVGFADHVAGASSTLGGTVGILGLAIPVKILVALALIWGCTAISMAGIAMSSLANNALVILIIVGMAALSIAGALSPHRPSTTDVVVGFSAVSVLVPIFFTYSGWNAAAYVTAQFREPSRDVPRALIIGTGIVTLLYVGVNVATLRVIELAPAGAASSPVATASRLLLGPAGSSLITALALSALASSVCAMIITGPRIYEAMAKNGALPARFASNRSGSPRAAILAQSAWTSVLVVTGTFGQLVTYTGFAIVVFSALTVLALLVLRRREGPPATFAVPFYPAIPVLYILATVVIAISSFRYAPTPSLIGLALILAGLPLRRMTRSFTSLSQLSSSPARNGP